MDSLLDLQTMLQVLNRSHDFCVSDEFMVS